MEKRPVNYKRLSKTINLSIFGFILFIISQYSMAAVCTLPTNSNIVNLFQWSDGHIFIVFDQNTNCNCPIPNRVAFHKNDDEKFIMSAALAALNSGKKVWIRAEDNGCVIHGNTAKIISFGIVP